MCVFMCVVIYYYININNKHVDSELPTKQTNATTSCTETSKTKNPFCQATSCKRMHLPAGQQKLDPNDLTKSS
jgi:hypothetical protein